MPQGAEGQGSADDPLDIASILAGTSSEEESTPEEGDPSGQGQAGAEQTPAGKAFQFGGRAYKSQKDAEKAHNQLYGKYSEQQGIVKQLKEALKNPQMLAQLSKDPAWAQILGKLGIEEAGEEIDRETEGEPEIPEGLQPFVERMEEDRAAMALEREEWSFEKKLGRAVTDQEHNQVMGIIARASSLSYAEAWKLAFHEKMLKEAAERKAQGASPKGPRPPPIPLGIPGVKVDPKKNVSEMSATEAREHLRNSDEFKELMSR